MGKVYVIGWLEYAKMWGEALIHHSHLDVVLGLKFPEVVQWLNLDDTVFINGQDLPDQFYEYVCRPSRARVFYYVHDIDVAQWSARWGKEVDWPLNVQHYLEALRHVDWVVTQSAHMATELEKVLARKVLVMDMCLDGDAMLSWARTFNSDSNWAVGYVSRFVPPKGQLDLMKALGMVPGPQKVALVGRKFDRSYLIDVLKACGPQVSLTLELNAPKQHVYEVALRSQIAVVPSYYEGWGMFPARAAWFGRPLLLYDIPVLRELYRDIGTFVPVGNVVALAAKLVEMFRNYQSFLDRAVSLQEHVRKRWAESSFAERFQAVTHAS